MPTPTNIVSLCPTYCRPWHVSSAVGQWLAQTHPWQHRWLLIGDDIDGLGELSTERIRRQIVAQGYPAEVASRVHYFRFAPVRSLPAKYDAMAGYALQWVCPTADLFTVWEDDDLYLNHHLAAISAAWNRRNRPERWWGHPERVWSDYTCELRDEPAAGRFHAALALTVKTWEQVPWGDTLTPEFDQLFMQALRQHAGPRHRYDLDFRRGEQTYRTSRPSYVFRWHSGSPHGQSFMPGHGGGWQEAAKQALRQEFFARRGAYDFMATVDSQSARHAALAATQPFVRLEQISPE